MLARPLLQNNFILFKDRGHERRPSWRLRIESGDKSRVRMLAFSILLIFSILLMWQRSSSIWRRCELMAQNFALVSVIESEKVVVQHFLFVSEEKRNFSELMDGQEY